MSLNRLSLFILLATSLLTLAACGGGAGHHEDSVIGTGGFDPSDTAPTIRVINNAKATSISRIYAYESYTGETLTYTLDDLLVPGARSRPLGGLRASQYDIYVEFTNGHRSDSGITVTTDPYNGSPIKRYIPRVNPGEVADVIIDY